MKRAVIFDMYGVLLYRRLLYNAAENPEMTRIVRELKERGTELYLLSNIFLYDADYYKRKFDFLKLFDGLYFSSDIGFSKPNARAFRHVLSENALEPEECVFFDDRRVNVEGAQALGIEAYVYINPVQVRSILGL